MNERQALELTVLWQEANHLFDQMQEVASGDGCNHFIQAVETIREDLGGAVAQATSDEVTWPLLVDDEPDWDGIIPFNGEVSPDEVRAKEPELPLTGERYNRRQLDMARRTGTSPLMWK